MDAFYASVEQSDYPALRGRPVVVALKGKRFSRVRSLLRGTPLWSALGNARCERREKCPDAIFLPPDFTRYMTVSLAVLSIFQRHTDHSEPLSLDEAYRTVPRSGTALP